MNFDPEKVERLYHTISGDMDVDASYNSNAPAYRYVKASNYDQLLELYRTLHALEPVWRHLVKRMYDEMGTTKAEEFIRRVQAGEHDVPSPWSGR